MGKKSEDKKVREFLAFCRTLPKGEVLRIIKQLQIISDDSPKGFDDNIEEITG